MNRKCLHKLTIKIVCIIVSACTITTYFNIWHKCTHCQPPHFCSSLPSPHPFPPFPIILLFRFYMCLLTAINKRIKSLNDLNIFIPVYTIQSKILDGVVITCGFLFYLLLKYLILDCCRAHSAGSIIQWSHHLFPYPDVYFGKPLDYF